MIRLDIDDRIARLTLDRPAARNAISAAGWQALAKQAAALAASDARVVILAGEGGFSAGSDLHELVEATATPDGRRIFREDMRAAIEAVAALPMPVVAAIDGDCIGAGLALALACDLRIAGRSARFAAPPARLGITYPVEDVRRLAAQVGRGQAARLLFSGEFVDAAEAARIGLVEQLAESAADAATTFATRCRANAAGSLVTLKQMLRGGGPSADHDALFDDAFAGRDFHEGVAAFRERRRPDFG